MVREQVVLLAEPLLHPDYVQTRQVVQLASGLIRTRDVTVVAPGISPAVRRRFQELGIDPVSVFPLFPISRSGRFEVASYILSWGLEAGFELNRILSERRLLSRDVLRITFSMTSAVPTDVWWAQGRPVGPTLEMISPSLAPHLRWAARILGPAIVRLDAIHMRRKTRRVRRVYANGQALAEWYVQHGTPVQGVIPSFGFRPGEFFPASTSPRRDYVLTYLGKETDTAALRSLVATGLPIRIFGAKSRNWIHGALPEPVPPNVRLLGRVSTDELRELYSHALFTAFPFTEEPFGLIPVESMACGTPVLTYRDQGPGETVLDGITGWLVDSAAEFVSVARSIFAAGPPATFASQCTQRARAFVSDSVMKRWESVIETIWEEDRLFTRPSPRPEAEILRRPIVPVGRSILAATATDLPIGGTRELSQAVGVRRGARVQRPGYGHRARPLPAALVKPNTPSGGARLVPDSRPEPSRVASTPGRAGTRQERLSRSVSPARRKKP